LSCKITSLNLSGNSSTPGVSYAWTGPGGFTSDQPNPAVTQSGTYVLTVTSDNGCSSSASAVVTSNTQAPDASAAGGVIDCQVTSITLGGNSSTQGVTWSWTGPGGFTSNQQNPAVSTAGNYVLTVTAANGCTSTATAQVTLDAAVPSATATGGTLTCLVTQVQLGGSSNQNGVGYSWTGPGGFTSGEQNPVVSTPGTYTLMVTAANGCSATTTALVGQNITLPTVVLAQPDQLDCVTETVTLNATGSDAGAGFIFQWISPNGHFVSGQNTLMPEVDAPGTYTLEILNQTNGCSHDESVTVTLSDEVPSGAALLVAGPVCFGEINGTIEIDSVQGGIPPYLYSLNGQPFQTGNQFGNLAAGQYTLTVQDVTGCEWETTLLLETPHELVVEVEAVDLGTDLLPLGESVELKATVLPLLPDSLFESIVWTPQGVDAACPGCLSLTVTPFETTEYTLTVTDLFGCTAADGVTVLIDKRRPVFVPNVFSPNNDGLNDLFSVFAGPSATVVKSFLVFNRWGETVYEYYDFEPNNPALGWDGRHRDKTLDPAVFTWFAEIEFIDGEVELFEGDVVLMR
jgi:gliding motility-associated-like protein